MNPDHELARVIARTRTLIAYEPLPSEIDWRACPLLVGTNVLFVPQDHKVDPIEYAKTLTATAVNPVALIIPGSAFDPYGARRGRGGGWYDRLLSALPKEWVRIGVCTQGQLSHQPLQQHEWDESVDFVVVKVAEKWVILKCHGQRNA